MVGYDEFLAGKLPAPTAVGIEPGPVHESLFGFQEVLTRWAIRRGRAALFADTGLGKTRMQLEWLRQMVGPTDSGLIVAPLAVAEQTIAEAQTLGLDVRFAAGQVGPAPGLWITNYEKLHKFVAEWFDAVVLDESSILKSVDGRTRQRLLSDWTVVPYRLCCTATPAPNDIAEMANHAEFLGVLTRAEMLAHYFVHDETAWRLKGHASSMFYRWLATWAAYVRRPSDLGFSDEGFNLPELRIRSQEVTVDYVPADGELFPAMVGGIQGRHIARRQSLTGRADAAAEVIRAHPGQWLVWCGLNDEQTAIAKLLGDDCVSIDGQTPEPARLEREQAWRRGAVRVMVTKPHIFGFGMNWQHCHQMLFLGLGDSWESYYQSIRRCYRFGQTEPVDVVIVTSETEGKVVENVWRKEGEAQMTANQVVAQVRDFERAEITGAEVSTSDYQTGEESGPGWRMLLGDSTERLRELDLGSVDLSLHSPPFASLYTYSASTRDLGNSRDYDEFMEHYRFIISGLLRATRPGRRAAVHVQQVSTTLMVHGVIGWRDFRADVVANFIAAGWVYDGEIVIDKDPQAQAIRTKAKALMFVQKNKDSSWSRPAMADYILLFRAPGDNPAPIKTDVSNDEWIRWARPIWYGIRESETLQAAAAREQADEKHIAPLQLETCERVIRLWSNKGELICDPFSGIGTVGYVALKKERRFIGIELKPSYFAQACINLKSAADQLVLLP